MGIILSAQKTDLRWIRGVGVAAIVASTALVCSTLYIAGHSLYITYLEPKAEAILVNKSRVELEAKYRELLAKSGYRNDVQVGSISDAVLIQTNRKLEIALRSGIKIKQ